MDEKIYVDWDESLAAVKFKGRWRFFYDVEEMFLLDYTKWWSDYVPEPGGWRYGTLIVDENNAEQWMNSIAHEITADQIPNTFLNDTSDRVKLTFVIDFDEKIWVGMMWNHDQSPLHEYQPDDWATAEENVYNFLPPEIRAYWPQ